MLGCNFKVITKLDDLTDNFNKIIIALIHMKESHIVQHSKTFKRFKRRFDSCFHTLLFAMKSMTNPKSQCFHIYLRGRGQSVRFV